MVNETKKIVKFNDLDAYGKVRCMEQYMNIICPYEDFSLDSFNIIGECIDAWVEATPDQFYFDENGDWYDEGRKVKA